MRDVNYILVYDVNDAASREMLDVFKKKGVGTPVPIQLVRKILPGIRATPALGVLFWATDLQGLVADVDAFADYIKNEDENLQMMTDLADAYVNLLVSSDMMEG